MYPIMIKAAKNYALDRAFYLDYTVENNLCSKESKSKKFRKNSL